MVRARKHARQRRRAKSLIGSMREFLTPEVFKCETPRHFRQPLESEGFYPLRLR